MRGLSAAARVTSHPVKRLCSTFLTRHTVVPPSLSNHPGKAVDDLNGALEIVFQNQVEKKISFHALDFVSAQMRRGRHGRPGVCPEVSERSWPAPPSVLTFLPGLLPQLSTVLFKACST